MLTKIMLCGAMALGVGAIGTTQEAQAGHGYYPPINPGCGYYGGPVQPYGPVYNRGFNRGFNNGGLNNVGFNRGIGNFGYGQGLYRGRPGINPYLPYGNRGGRRGFFVQTPNFALGIRR
ncbi:hypothetical protein [Stratiformator vulcanicus]|uniref:Uncharacterized protein n=1 Tax=Stratiformator vulcanicus TaxID=2527980 RepID=A0A517R7T1_9PLAN|nr:hypothetical protein [Stratiformator vulcanicus]QDT39944.1 hypothetical protein Pan189_43560 [Stratiformator vulcanicus]